MRREEQIKNMARAIHLNCHKGLTSTEAEMIAKWCYQEIDKKVSEIFEEIEKIISKEINRCESIREQHVDLTQRKYWEGGESAIRKTWYWLAELKKKHTEEGK